MAIDKEKILEIFDQLHEPDKKTALDFMMYLAERKEDTPFDWKAWEENLPIDDEELSEEELRQLNSDDEYITWKEAKREFKNLPGNI